MRFVVGLNLMQAIRTVAFHKNDVSVPFLMVKTSCFCELPDVESMNMQDFDLEIEKNSDLLIFLFHVKDLQIINFINIFLKIFVRKLT